MLQKRPLQDTELYADPDSSEKIQDSMSSSEDEWYTSTANIMHAARCMANGMSNIVHAAQTKGMIQGAIRAM
jgi:hypothetical protein